MSELHYLKFAIIVNTPEFVCNEKSDTIFCHNCYFTLTRFLVFVLLCWNNCKKLDHWRCLLRQGALLGIWLTSAVIQEAQIKFYMKSQLQLFQILSIDSFPTHGWFWSQNVTKCLVWDMSHEYNYSYEEFRCNSLNKEYLTTPKYCPSYSTS